MQIYPWWIQLLAVYPISQGVSVNLKVRYHRQYNLLTYIITVFRSIACFFSEYFQQINKTPPVGVDKSVLSLGTFVDIGVFWCWMFSFLHHYIMARTDTTGCLNYQHDRRYCCHHCPWYLSAVYCLNSIVYHGSHPLAHVTSRNHVTT